MGNIQSPSDPVYPRQRAPLSSFANREEEEKKYEDDEDEESGNHDIEEYVEENFDFDDTDEYHEIQKADLH